MKPLMWHPYMGTPSEMASPYQLLYVMRAGDCWKIGIATDPLARLRSVQCGNHEPVRLWGHVCFPHWVYLGKVGSLVAKMEHTVHGLLDPWKTNGEWFRAPE